MVERGKNLRLAPEAGHSFGVLRNGRRQDLDSSVAVQPRVACAVHLAHSAFTKRADHLIGADSRADREAHVFIRPVMCGGRLYADVKSRKRARETIDRVRIARRSMTRRGSQPGKVSTSPRTCHAIARATRRATLSYNLSEIAPVSAIIVDVGECSGDAARLTKRLPLQCPL